MFAHDPSGRLYAAQMAGGYWDVARNVYVRGRHPEGMLFDSEGHPIGREADLPFEDISAHVEDTTFNEPRLLDAIYSHMYDAYDDAQLQLLRSLRAREGLQTFLRNSIERGIVIEEVE